MENCDTEVAHLTFQQLKTLTSNVMLTTGGEGFGDAALVPIIGANDRIDIVDSVTGDIVANIKTQVAMEKLTFVKWIIPTHFVCNDETSEVRQHLGIALVSNDFKAYILAQQPLQYELRNVLLINVLTAYIPVGALETTNISPRLYLALVFVYEDATMQIYIPWHNYMIESSPFGNGAMGKIVHVAGSRQWNSLEAYTCFKTQDAQVHTQLSRENLQTNQVLAIAFECGTVAILEVATQTILSRFQIDEPPECMALSVANKTHFVATSIDKCFVVYNVYGKVIYRTIITGGDKDKPIVAIKVANDNPCTFLVKLENWHILNVLNQLNISTQGGYSGNVCAYRRFARVPNIVCIGHSLLNPHYLFCADAKGDLYLISDDVILQGYGNPFKSRTFKIVCHPRLPGIFAIALVDGSVYLIFLEPENPALFNFTFLMKMKANVKCLAWFLTSTTHGPGFEPSKRSSRDNMVQRTWLTLSRCNYDSLVVACNSKDIVYCNINGPLRPTSFPMVKNVTFIMPISWPLWYQYSCMCSLHNQGLNVLALAFEQHLAVGSYINGICAMKIFRCNTDSEYLNFSLVDVINIPMLGVPTSICISNKQYNQYQRYSHYCAERLACVTLNHTNCINALQEYIAIGDDLGHIYTSTLVRLFYSAINNRRCQARILGYDCTCDVEPAATSTCVCHFARTRLPAAIDQINWGISWNTYDRWATLPNDCLCNDDIVCILAIVFVNGDAAMYRVTCEEHARIANAKHLSNIEKDTSNKQNINANDEALQQSALDVTTTAIAQEAIEHGLPDDALQLKIIEYLNHGDYKASCFIERMAPCHFQFVIAGSNDMACLVFEPQDISNII